MYVRQAGVDFRISCPGYPNLDRDAGGYLLLAERPDLSCDGVFNFADPPPAVYALVTAVGDNVRSTVLRMRRAEIAQFLQISADPPNPFWPAALSAFFYYLLYLFKQKSLRNPKQQNERLKK